LSQPFHLYASYHLILFLSQFVTTIIKLNFLSLNNFLIKNYSNN